jgi:hypothetical protein
MVVVELVEEGHVLDPGGSWLPVEAALCVACSSYWKPMS